LTDPAKNRYAIYWVPAREHPLWQAGCAWLGRDPESGDPGQAPSYAAAPWRYGFHATLKAPMRLRDGLSETAFLTQVQRLALAQRCFALPRLAVSSLADFIALRPLDPIDAAHPLRALADACVIELEGCRQPLAAAELRVRSAAVEGAAGLHNLRRWGYPHVFDRWRFHMTLSDAGRSGDAVLLERARRHFEVPLAAAIAVNAMAVFREDAAGVPLNLLCRLPLAGCC
jgi:Protein of unknown function (DUF1045)